MGRKSKKRGDICIHIADSLCCTSETNITLSSNYIPICFFKTNKNKIKSYKYKKKLLKKNLNTSKKVQSSVCGRKHACSCSTLSSFSYSWPDTHPPGDPAQPQAEVEAHSSATRLSQAQSMCTKAVQPQQTWRAEAMQRLSYPPSVLG